MPQLLARVQNWVWNGQCRAIATGCLPLALMVLLAQTVVARQETDTVGDSDAHTIVTPRDVYCDYLPPEGKANGKRIVFLAGDEEYRSEEAFPMLGQMLSQRHGFHCTVLFPINPETGEIDPNNQRNIPGMEMLQDADLVVMGWRFRQLPDSAMQYFVSYMERGGPLIAVRTSTHAFRYPGDSESPFRKYSFDSREWPGGFGRQVLGETWVSHHGNHGSESTRGIPVESMQEHPILRGVKDVWGPTDVYGIRDLPEDAKVLLRGAILTGMNPDDPIAEDDRNRPMMPLAWIRRLPVEGRDRLQRIFATTMGSSTDFANEGLRRLTVNAVFWCLAMEDQIVETLDTTPVGNYEPTPFGFNRFQKGLHPSDFQLPESGADSSQTDEWPAAMIDGQGPGWRALGEADFVNANGFDDTWTWQDGGVLACSGQPVGVLRSAEPVTNFEMVLEWKHLRKAGNSGVFVWTPKASLDALKPGQLPEGIECQILDHGYTEQYETQSGKPADWFTTDGDVFPVGASKMNPFPPLSPNGVRSFPSARHTRGFNEWNHYYIRAINGEVRLWVNGHEVSGGNRCEPATGYFALESEGSPILFRNMRIRILP